MEKEGAYILLAALWFFYYLIHSVLASSKVKRYACAKLPKVWPYYRIIYNLFAAIGLAAVFLFQWTLPEVILLETHSWTLCVGALMMFIGLGIGLMAFMSFNKSEFLGLEQLRGKGGKKQKLVTTGLYGLVRHPLYFSLILIITGYLLYSFRLSNLIFVGATFVYLVVGTRLEEKKLIDAFGRDYLIYKRKVRMLIPFLF